MNRAYLVIFTTVTRVVVDVPEDFDPNNCNLAIKEQECAYNTIIDNARENIMEEPTNYLYGENAEIMEDTECPYGTFEGD